MCTLVTEIMFYIIYKYTHQIYAYILLVFFPIKIQTKLKYGKLYGNKTVFGFCFDQFRMKIYFNRFSEF